MSRGLLHASLPMYDWPEARPETEATWAAIRDAAPGLPETLGSPDWGQIDAYWRDPALVFSQTCWGPLSLGLIAHLRPLAQPDYGAFAGGRGPWYRSALVARPEIAAELGLDTDADAPVPETPAASLPGGMLAGRRFAMNGPDSLSGFLSLKADLGADPRKLAAETLVTGGHRASVKAVAEGRADIAAIDCRSWDMARRFEPCAAGLRVVGWTSERPGLPYVTSRATPETLVTALQDRLITMGCHKVTAGSER